AARSSAASSASPSPRSRASRRPGLSEAGGGRSGRDRPAVDRALTSRLPLQGIRILDFTVVWAGPSATMLLADLGAEVIRVEALQHFPPSTRGRMPRPTRETAMQLGFIGRAYVDLDPGERPWDRHAMFNC